MKVKSLGINTCANVYTQGKFTCVIPMPNKMGPKCANSLIEVTDNVSILDELVTNGAGEFTGKHIEFVKNCCCMHICMKCTKLWRKKQNFAKCEIGILSCQWKQQMTKKTVPCKMTLGSWSNL